MPPNAFYKSFYNVQIYIEPQTAGPCARLSKRKLFLGYHFMSPQKKWKTKTAHRNKVIFDMKLHGFSIREKNIL